MNYSQMLRPPPMQVQLASPYEVQSFMTELMENSKVLGKKYILIACFLCALASFTVADNHRSLLWGVLKGENNAYMTQLNAIQNCYAFVSTFYGVGILSWCLLAWSGLIFLLNLFRPWCAGICVFVQGLLFLSCVNFLVTSKTASCSTSTNYPYAFGEAPFLQLLILTLTSLFGLIAIYWYEKQKDQVLRNQKNLALIMSQ